MNAIAIPDEHNPILTIDVKDLFDPENPALSEALDHLRASVTSEVFDVTEEKGRKQIARLAHKVARTKTAIDGAGKEYVSGLKNQAKKIDAIRKHAREYLDDVKAEVRAPLTEWEEQEKARQEEIERLIQDMHSLGNFWDHTGLAQLNSKQLMANVAILEGMEVDIRYGERMTEAKLVKADILSKLSAQAAAMAALEEQQQQEEQARIAAERLAREEREREIAERARQREREAAQQREAEQKRIAERQLMEAKQQAERERIAAQQREERAKQQAERERAAKERLRLEKEEAERVSQDIIDRLEKERKQEAKRKEEMKASHDRRRAEAAEAFQTIINRHGLSSSRVSPIKLIDEIIAGNVPHVRFTD